MGAFLSEFQQLRRGIDATNMIGLLAVEGKIQSGPDTDVEHAAAGGFSDPFSEGYHLFLLHHEVEHSRKQPCIVKAHLSLSKDRSFISVPGDDPLDHCTLLRKRPPETDAQSGAEILD